MTEPKRLAQAPASPLEVALLRAARSRAPRQARQRAIAAATAAVSATGLAASTAGAGGVAAKGGAVATLKWLGVLGFVGLGAGTVTTAFIRDRQQAAASRAQEAPAVHAAASRPAVASTRNVGTPLPSAPSEQARTEPAERSVPSVPASLGPSPAAAGLAESSRRMASSSSSPTGAAPASATADSSIIAELHTLDQARAALSNGSPAQALALLDAYALRFPHASMKPEATVLRIEALERAGDLSAATRVAQAFLRSNPSSPYASRIRSLLGESNRESNP